MLGIFRDEALRRRAETEIADAADQEQPGPGINVNAEFEAAEPARQHDLRHEGEERGDDADDEGGTGETPHQRRIAAAGEQCAPAGDRAVKLRLPRGQPMPTRRLLGTDRCHNDLCAATGGGTQETGIFSNDALRIGWRKLTIASDLEPRVRPASVPR